MKIKEIDIMDRWCLYSKEKDSPYLYYNAPSKSTLCDIKDTINRTEALRDLDLTLYCIRVSSKEFSSPQKGKGFELFVDKYHVCDSFIKFDGYIQALTGWLRDKLLIFKELKSMSEGIEPSSSGIGRVEREDVNMLFEMFIKYFYKSDRKVNKKNKKEFIEIVNKIYKF